MEVVCAICDCDFLVCFYATCGDDVYAEAGVLAPRSYGVYDLFCGVISSRLSSVIDEGTHAVSRAWFCNAVDDYSFSRSSVHESHVVCSFFCACCGGVDGLAGSSVCGDDLVFCDCGSCEKASVSFPCWEPACLIQEEVECFVGCVVTEAAVRFISPFDVFKEGYACAQSVCSALGRGAFVYRGGGGC